MNSRLKELCEKYKVSTDINIDIVSLPGKKHARDEIIQIDTRGRHWLTFGELAVILFKVFSNEEVIYAPPTFKGKDMLMDYIEEVYHLIPRNNNVKKTKELGEFFD